MAQAAGEPRQNRILAALPASDYERLRPELEPVAVARGGTLHELGGAVGHVYFPTTCVVSLLRPMEDGTVADVAVAGNDSLVGISALIGDAGACARAVVQRAGLAWRLDAHVLRREFRLGGALQRMALRYTQALITQMSQAALCNKYHSPDRHLCRWLLLSMAARPATTCRCRASASPTCWAYIGKARMPPWANCRPAG